MRDEERRAERERREQLMQSPEQRRVPARQADDPFDLPPGPQLVDVMYNGRLHRVPADMAAQFQQLPPPPAPAPRRGRRVSWAFKHIFAFV
jgi:hypothetical protein